MNIWLNLIFLKYYNFDWYNIPDDFFKAIWSNVLNWKFELHYDDPMIQDDKGWEISWKN